MMKSISGFVCTLILASFLSVLVLFACGCGPHPRLGETQAEAERRRIRNSRIAQQQLGEDIETCLLLKKPCRLSTKRIP
jgi:hypothetical protein